MWASRINHATRILLMITHFRANFSRNDVRLISALKKFCERLDNSNYESMPFRSPNEAVEYDECSLIKDSKSKTINRETELIFKSAIKTRTPHVLIQLHQHYEI